MSAPRPIVGVSVCVFDPSGAALLVLRSRPPFQGLWSLPGGRVEWGERLEAAARRELAEETGIHVPAVELSQVHEAIDGTAHAVITVFRTGDPVSARPQASDDAADARFFARAEIEAMDRAGQTTEGLAGVIRRAAER
ncbi:NUDIX domain-containing protein [Aureimonas jatrophae]|uniref:8-oxo-dGTP diphosphatase n=1 Tax=Aureimonas jatrophae TaxID=1166073 RepID=A0A1H0CXL0_9HYPH|nr:NUDIX domain-containing protein [Aureimonas jatrophae]MBB3949398.1 8-oxo-dGTP diphosphatase [Aureimonas jatrophae]SDN62536.1 8-oxo-dGTP diphosphatase [Aureimonas jatrophae]